MIALVITAAGLSHRFGADKLAFPVNGVPMGIRTLRLYEDMPFCRKVLVTSGERRYLIEEAGKLGYSIVINPAPEKGLSSSVKAGLAAALEGGTPGGVLFAAADMPYLSASSVQSLIKAFEKNGDRICALAGPDGTPVKPVIFPKSLYPELAGVFGDSGGKTIMKAHPGLIFTVSASPGETADIDIKEDLK